MPHFLRKPIVLDFLYSIVKPIQDKNDDLVALDDQVRGILRINSQMAAFQKTLNDRYDPSMQGIVILDSTKIDPKYLRQIIELRTPVFKFQKSEGEPDYFLNQRAEIDSGLDFIVQVPGTVTFDENEMRSFIDKYRVAGKVYEIQIV